MPMKKFINDPANLTSELLDGLVQCYPNQLALKNERIVVRANPKPADKVAIVTLGGTIEDVHTFLLPGTDMTRTILVIRKIRPTPARYPRGQGKPEKEPIV